MQLFFFIFSSFATADFSATSVSPTSGMRYHCNQIRNSSFFLNFFTPRGAEIFQDFSLSLLLPFVFVIPAKVCLHHLISVVRPQLFLAACSLIFAAGSIWRVLKASGLTCDVWNTTLQWSNCLTLLISRPGQTREGLPFCPILSLLIGLCPFQVGFQLDLPRLAVLRVMDYLVTLWNAQPVFWLVSLGLRAAFQCSSLWSVSYHWSFC